MSGNGAPPAWHGGGPIPPVPPATGRPDGIPPLPPALIAAPPGVAGTPLEIVPLAPVPEQPTRPRRPQAADVSPGLGPAFAGTPATTAMRIAAFTFDAAAVALAAAVVLLISRSVMLAGLTALELVIGLWVLEARTGLTIGNLLLRLRTARGDRPFTPGAGRQLVRGLITGAGFIVAVGSWIIVASSAWDHSGKRRSWADRAADTVVVAVPSRQTSATGASPNAAGPLAPPQIVALGSRTPAVDEDSQHTDSRSASRRSDAQPEAAPVVDRPVFSVAPSQSSSGPGDTVPAADSGALLLIFDTGQRVQLDLPVVANLGRAPVASAHEDRLVVVTDPDSSVSKTHLRIEHSRGRTWVTDFGSTNGSDIRSDDAQTTELVQGERVLLDDADRVRIGNRTFTFNLLLGTDGSAGERA